MSLAIEAVKLVFAGYLIVLAVTAALGFHRPVLAYPFHAGYSFLRVLLMGVTFGRVRLQQDAKRTKMRQAKRVRDIRGTLDDIRQRRAEEKALARGEDPYPTSGSWASSSDEEDDDVHPPGVWS